MHVNSSGVNSLVVMSKTATFHASIRHLIVRQILFAKAIVIHMVIRGLK
ncbi:MAG: hypothetical protein ACE3L7_00100 [Candidatus Pristimantibacillus sp.]